MTEPLDLDAIQTRADAATPGPWNFDGDSIRRGISGLQIAGMYGFSRYHRKPEDAAFIAHARTDVAALVDEVRRLRELLNERTADIADKALENASLRSQLTAIRSWAETTSNGSAAAAIATLMDDPPRISYCGYCGFSHASCRC